MPGEADSRVDYASDVDGHAGIPGQAGEIAELKAKNNRIEKRAGLRR